MTDRRAGSGGRGAYLRWGRHALFVLSCALITIGSAEAGGEKAYEAGLARAKNKDWLGAYAKWREAAEEGHTQAMLGIAQLHGRGLGVKEDREEEFRWVRQAAEAGNVEGMFVLGNLYAHGLGVEADSAQAVRWYRKAADLGSTRAMDLLSDAHRHGRLGLEQDYDRALKWYRRAAELGSPVAMNRLGIVYLAGQMDLERDHAQALRWFRKAVAKDHPYAMHNLARMYEQGKGVVQDYAEALRWYEQAGEGGLLNGYYDAGRFFAGGLGVRKDIAQAFRLYLRAAEGGMARAMYAVGKAYEEGQGVESNRDESRRWIRKAAEKGLLEAQVNTATHVLYDYWHSVERSRTSSEVEMAIQTLREAAKKENAEAMWALGMAYERGIGVHADLERARTWFRQAADKGYENAADHWLVRIPWAKVSSRQFEEVTKERPIAFENDLGMRFVLIPSHEFRMGSDEDEAGRGTDEDLFRTYLFDPYYMQITEVTNAQFKRFKPEHDSGSGLDGDDQPVANVSWDDAAAFARWLTRRDGNRTYRLPTEMEWEGACRAYRGKRYCFGDDISELHHYGNWQSHGKESPRRDAGIDRHRLSAPVTSYRPNDWGLYDMHGNVFEWCGDWYAPYPSLTEPKVSGGIFTAALNQHSPTRSEATIVKGTREDGRGRKASYSGPARVVRGGGWTSGPASLRSAYRGRLHPFTRWPSVGFRLVAEAPD